MTGIRQHNQVAPCTRHLMAMTLVNCILAVAFVSAQTDHYEKIFTTENGLPHNHILSIAADKTGFLWLGTWDGLSRFDGYEFHNYFHDPEDSSTIPYFTVREVTVDKYNNVWIFPLSNMLSRYRRATDDFYNYETGSDPVFKQTGVMDMERDSEGNLLIIGSGGIARFDSASSQFIKIVLVDENNVPLTVGKWDKLSFDNEGYIWLISNTEIIKGTYPNDPLNPSVKIISKYPFLKDDFFPRPNGYTRTFKFGNLPDRSILFFSNSGLRTMPANFRADMVPENFNPGDDHYWYSQDGKIHSISGKENITIDLNPGETPQTLFIDPFGIIWYCTLFQSGMGTGLHRYTRTPGYFRHYIPEINGMPSVVYSVSKDDRGNLLVGTEANNFISCISKDGSLTRLNKLSREDASRSTHVRSMIRFSEGIFIGYMKERLDFYDYKTRKFINLFRTDDPTRQKVPYGFRTLFRDPTGNLLVGTLGLFRYIPGEQHFSKIWQSDPPGKGIFSMRADPKGIVWAGTGKLLLKLTEDYRVDTVYSISNTEYNIEDISFDAEGNVWLALLGGGLEQFNPLTGVKEFYTTSDGLSNNTTYSILKDRRENLWITTNNGISRFNIKTKKFRIFGPTDGLLIHEFNSDAAFMDEEGRMYFGGMGGVVSFHPDSIMDFKIDEIKTPLIITEFRVSGIPRYFPIAVYETARVVLNKGDDNFGIAFACLDFRNAEKIKYRYRISGYQEKWNEVDHLHRRINIAGLKPATYTVEIECADIFGDWNNQLRLAITIPPQFYETIWFSLLMIFMGLGVITLFIILNNRQIRIKEGQKQQYLKLESIRGQMNPHFIFNSLNSINYFIANNDRHAANSYISNFSKLIRSFLSNMSQEYISLTDEIASLEDYLKLEFLRFGDKFDYSVSTDQIQLTDIWEVFPGMVQPFVENAIWHGVRGLQDRKGLIHVGYSETKSGGILCTVTDDGVGRRLAALSKNYYVKKKSRGIQLILERMHLINHLENKNYVINIEDLYPHLEECGTRIEIEIPSRLKQKRYN